MLGPMISSLAAPPDFADKAFKQVWERTDAPVLAGQVQRSWYWGPGPGQARNEPYSGAKSGARLVQYFDKARMEINNPAVDRSSPWFVTTGLLVAEMVLGKQQVGDAEFRRLRPAEIAVAGDGLSVDPDAPTYTSFYPVASLAGPDSNRAPKLTGKTVMATLDRAGQVGTNEALGLYPGAKLAAYSDLFGHNIPQAMWSFLNAKGAVLQGGSLVDGQPLADWVFVMGYPITEPYWARVKIEGVYHDVLIQLDQRRTLVYVPSFIEGWQVQMGNVGLHYYRWLYGGSLPVPLVNLTPAAQVAVPPSVDAEVSESSAPTGTPIDISLTGFRPGEDIVSWFTAPDATAGAAPYNLKAGPDGKVERVSVQTKGFVLGLWAITFHGKGSNHESIAYFALTPPASTSTPRASTPTATAGKGSAPSATPTIGAVATRTTPTSTRTKTPTPRPRGSVTPSPTVPIVPTEPPSGLQLAVRPGYGPPGASFTFEASGLAPNEPLHVSFTDPNGAVVYPAGSNNGVYTADAQGRWNITLVPAQAFPSAPIGTWLFKLKGDRTGVEGIVGFTLLD